MGTVIAVIFVLGFPIAAVASVLLVLRLRAARAELKRYAAVNDVGLWVQQQQYEVSVLLQRAQADAHGIRHQAHAEAAATQNSMRAYCQQLLADATAQQQKVHAEAQSMHRRAEANATAAYEAAIAQHQQLRAEIEELGTSKVALERELRALDEPLVLRQVGFDAPRYNFSEAVEYKLQLERIAADQAIQVKAGAAAVCSTEWSVGGSRTEGRKITSKILRLMLRAFNGESDALIGKVRFDNADVYEARLVKSWESINKLGDGFSCAITADYLRLKIQELHLVYSYQDKLQSEREEQRELREQMRDEERAQREIERAEREAEKEEERYARALERARIEAQHAAGAKQMQLLEQVRELEQKVAEAEERRQRAVSMAQMTKRGHVYVLSNLGSFGEHVYKIGMTRRLDPQDRVDELGDASVPFAFDIHAMIQTDDAPALERALHGLFETHRLNKINRRKEFFRVTLDDIERVVMKHHGEFKLTRQAEAIEYRKSLVAAQDAETRQTNRATGIAMQSGV